MTIDKSRKFVTLVRLGYAVRGLTYVLLGVLALGTSGKAMEGATGVFDYLREFPLGKPLLWIVALGLIAYAIFKLLSAVANIQNRPEDTKGMVKRVGDFASGVVHVGLAYVALRFARGERRQSDGGESMAQPVMDFELGPLVIGLIGLGTLIAAAMQVKQAATGGFMKHIAGHAPRAVETAGRVGFAARAVVFAIVGWSLVRAAWREESTAVKGLGEALLELRDAGLLYTLVALGLLLFGAFSLITARWRIVPDIHRGDLRPSLHRPHR